MISDVCFDAVSGLNHYLNDPDYTTWYHGVLRQRIIKVRDELDAIRRALDNVETNRN